jgi:hypothetical protein
VTKSVSMLAMAWLYSGDRLLSKPLLFLARHPSFRVGKFPHGLKDPRGQHTLAL